MHRKLAMIALVVVVTGCGQEKPRGDSTADAGDTARNAEFWKEVASTHFTEDRSHRGDPLPEVALRDGNGRLTSLAARRGKPVLVNFWAHWCVPCRAEMPTIDAMTAQRGSTLQVVAVNEDAMHESRDSLGELSMNPSIVRLTDPSAALTKNVASGGLPTTVLYGSDGRERWRLVGVLDWTQPQAHKLLAEAI